MWIKLDSNLLEWRWFTYPYTLTVWLYLLLKANYKDTQRGNETIHRGEVFVSQEKIAEDTGLTRKQVRTALGHLQETGEIRANRKIGKAVVISIPKYNEYQGEGPIEGQRRANKGPDLQNRQNIQNLSPPYNPPKSKPYSVPTIEDVREYERISSKGKNPDQFYAHYSRAEWKANDKPVYDWRRLYDTWEAPPEEKKVQREPVEYEFVDEDGYKYKFDGTKHTLIGRPGKRNRGGKQ